MNTHMFACTAVVALSTQALSLSPMLGHTRNYKEYTYGLKENCRKSGVSDTLHMRIGIGKSFMTIIIMKFALSYIILNT